MACHVECRGAVQSHADGAHHGMEGLTANHAPLMDHQLSICLRIPETMHPCNQYVSRVCNISACHQRSRGLVSLSLSLMSSSLRV
mmetsp:Transcript_2719/g.6006  ORF Transcript_2719/g.6006 Transcript_2719/m.6006 type:complete len:85 (-) Transcript_2719:1015-1269(-)